MSARPVSPEFSWLAPAEEPPSRPLLFPKQLRLRELILIYVLPGSMPGSPIVPSGERRFAFDGLAATPVPAIVGLKGALLSWVLVSPLGGRRTGTGRVLRSFGWFET